MLSLTKASLDRCYYTNNTLKGFNSGLKIKIVYTTKFLNRVFKNCLNSNLCQKLIKKDFC